MKLLGLFTLPDWVILAVTVAVLLYMYATKYKNYWKKQDVAEEKFALVFGMYWKIFFTPIHLLDQERYQKYGKLFGVYEGRKPTLFVADPELIKLVLVKDFVALPERRRMNSNDPLLDNMMSTVPLDRWRTIRPAASPAFTTGRLRKMNALIDDCARVSAEHLQKAAEMSEDIDVKQFLSHFALDTIARCAFGTKLDSHAEQTSHFVTKARQIFGQNRNIRLILFFLFPAVFRLFKISPLNSDLLEYFKSLALTVMSRRIAQNTRSEDFLQLMMDAHSGSLLAAAEDATSVENQLFNLGDEYKPEQGDTRKALTEDEALAQCVLFFLAGQETSASALAFAVYLLALHPDIQEKLRQEADECFETHGKQPSFDIISKQKYVHAVISEALRMYPPASRLERCAAETYTLGDTGITVPKDCIVAIPVYAMHHDPENFSDPYTFNPERFLGDNLSSIRPYTYLPFGAGPRNCVGMRFALHAIKLCLLHAVHNVRFVRTSKTKVPLEFCKGFVSLTATDLTVGVRKRSPPNMA